MHQPHQAAQSGFKATDARGGEGKLAPLVNLSVGGRVSGDNINHVFLESLNQGLDVPFRSQGRIYLGVGLIADDLFLGQGQVVWGNLGGNPDAFLLATANKLNRALSADMGNVQPGSGQLGKGQVAGDHNLLGGGGYAAKP